MRHWVILFRFIIVLMATLFCCEVALAQENITTLGLQIKPMVPSKYLGTGTEDDLDGNFQVQFKPRPGVNFGMVVRKGFTRMWSFETGICLVQRNYLMTLSHPGLDKPEELSFRYICYEIPVQGIVFVKLGDQLFMNASGGFSIDAYPSNVQSNVSTRRDTINYDFTQKTYRNGWLQFSILANYGFEWRTKKSGYFYLGLSYHRPFSSIGTTKIVLERNQVPSRVDVQLGGNYLTMDFRYFFQEKPERKKPKS